MRERVSNNFPEIQIFTNRNLLAKQDITVISSKHPIIFVVQRVMPNEIPSAKI